MAKISRRQFVGISVVAGAGIGLGIGWPLLKRYNERNKTVDPLGSGDTQRDIEPWIRITPDNKITVTISRSEMGQGVETALAMIVAEELDADWSLIQTQQATSDRAYGNQHTAASSSVKQLWAPMREVAATARQMLINTAAKEWGVDAESCSTNNSRVLHADGDLQTNFGSIAEKAAKETIPSVIELKAVKDFEIIGQRMSRLDIPRKVDGTAIFGWDVDVPNMAIAAITRCPNYGGHVVEFNGDKALQIDGVHAVLPVNDPYEKNDLFNDERPYGIAVVGDSYWAVKRGQEALDIVWDDGPNASFSSESIAAMLATWVEQDDGDVIVDRGQVSGVASEENAVAEASYQVPYLAHVTMSPMCCVASVHEDGCDVWAPTQSPNSALRLVRELTGLPRSAVTVRKTYIGGGFGRRQRQDYVGDAVQISQAIKRPVKLLSSREEDIQNDWFRPMSFDIVRAELNAEGYPISWHHKIASTENHVLSSGGVDKVPYDIPNMRVVRAKPDIDPPIRVSTWRGVANSQNAFVIECFMNELASRGGHDPFEYRRQLLQNSPRYLQVLELAAEKADWYSQLPAGQHRGIAMHACGGSIAAEIVEISIDEQKFVQVHNVTCVVDCGLAVHPDGVEAQIEGSIIDGLTATLHSEITIKSGRVEQSNFHDYPLLRMHQIPSIAVHIIDQKSPELIGGVGEVGLPPLAPAIANAVFFATGQRVRKLPIRLA